jgi:hypothetical protein
MHEGPSRVVFHPENVGTEKWIVPSASSDVFAGGGLAKLSADWTYVAL